MKIFKGTTRRNTQGVASDAGPRVFRRETVRTGCTPGSVPVFAGRIQTEYGLLRQEKVTGTAERGLTGLTVPSFQEYTHPLHIAVSLALCLNVHVVMKREVYDPSLKGIHGLEHL